MSANLGRNRLVTPRTSLLCLAALVAVRRCENVCVSAPRRFHTALCVTSSPLYPCVTLANLCINYGTCCILGRALSLLYLGGSQPPAVSIRVPRSDEHPLNRSPHSCFPNDMSCSSAESTPAFSRSVLPPHTPVLEFMGSLCTANVCTVRLCPKHQCFPQSLNFL